MSVRRSVGQLVDNRLFSVTPSDSIRSVRPSVRPFIEFIKYFLKKHSSSTVLSLSLHRILVTNKPAAEKARLASIDVGGMDFSALRILRVIDAVFTALFGFE